MKKPVARTFDDSPGWVQTNPAERGFSLIRDCTGDRTVRALLARLSR
jgi:hypothetical protein